MHYKILIWDIEVAGDGKEIKGGNIVITYRVNMPFPDDNNIIEGIVKLWNTKIVSSIYEYYLVYESH